MEQLPNSNAEGSVPEPLLQIKNVRISDSTTNKRIVYEYTKLIVYEHYDAQIQYILTPSNIHPLQRLITHKMEGHQLMVSPRDLFQRDMPSKVERFELYPTPRLQSSEDTKEIICGAFPRHKISSDITSSDIIGLYVNALISSDKHKYQVTGLKHYLVFLKQELRLYTPPKQSDAFVLLD